MNVGSAQAQETKSPKIKFYLFYSKDCEDCRIANREIIFPLKQQYNLIIEPFDIDNSDAYKLLLKLEEKYEDRDNKIPIVVIGECILGGKEEIEKELGKIIQKYEQIGCDFPSISRSGVTPPLQFESKKVYLAYFYGKRCRECSRATYDLKYLEKKYPNFIVKKFDIDILENKKLNEALCELYEIPQKKRLVVPMAFIGEEFLRKREINSENIAELIDKYKLIGTSIPWEEAKGLEEKSERNIRERFNAISVFTILFAGLVDGVNPCAFATILFFIAFLSFIGKKGKELLVAGISFTCSVFIVYFLIGAGIFHFVKSITFIPIIRKIIFSAVGISAIVFGGLSIYDYSKFKRGKYEEAKLQLPKFLKRRIHTDIREKMQMKNYIVASLVIGILVSLSEFVCTGQVYFPVITFMTTQIPSLKLKGLTYLFLYNLAFIVPLVIVFITAYKGTTSTDLNLFWKRHGVATKLAISILFFLLGGLLIFYAYY